MLVSKKYIVFVLYIVLAGCVTIPRAEIDAYGESFKQAFNAGTLLLDKISPIFSANSRASTTLTDCGLSVQGYPKCFRPDLARKNAIKEEHPAIKVRRLALLTIDTYNQMLVDAAEGKAIDASTKKIEELRNLVQTILSLTGVVGRLPVLVDVVAKNGLTVFLNELRAPLSAAAVRRLVVAGKEPVKLLLARLVVDTSSMYEVYKEGTKISLTEAQTAMLVANKGGSSSAKAAAAARVSKHLNEINGYYAELAAYVKVLDATSLALDALVSASENPGFSISNSTESLTRLGVLKTRADEFWQLVRAVK